VLAAAALFQFRVFDDPILAYHGFMQFVVLGLLLSLLALDRYLTGGSRLWLGAAALAYLAVLLTYEVTYPLFLLHAALAVARGRGWKAAAVAALPFAGAALACASVSVALRLVGISLVNSPYQPNLDVAACARTFGRQLFAALPLSYLLRLPRGALPGSALFRFVPILLAVAALLVALAWWRIPAVRKAVSGRGLALLAVVLWALPGIFIALSPKYRTASVPGAGDLPTSALYYGVGLIAFLLALASVARLRRESPAATAVSGRGLALLGLLLWTLPGILIALSPKYQATIVLGVGYLPVYAQYYGVGLLALAGACWVVRRGLASPAATVTASAVLATVVGLTAALNTAVAGAFAEQRQVRENVEAALDAGLLDAVPDGATLLLDNPHGLWHNDMIALCLDGPHSHSEYFYFLHSGKKVTTVVKGHDEAPLSTGPLYEVRDECASSVLLMRRDADLTDEVRLFVRGVAPFSVAGRRAATTDSVADGRAEVVLDRDDLTVIHSGTTGAVYAVPPSAGPLLADSLRVLFR
jgi:hypothetical protein